MRSAAVKVISKVWKNDRKLSGDNGNEHKD